MQYFLFINKIKKSTQIIQFIDIIILDKNR
jgi:hypothetical protein